MSTERDLRHRLRTGVRGVVTQGTIDAICEAMRPVHQRLNEVECELALLRRRHAQSPGHPK